MKSTEHDEDATVLVAARVSPEVKARLEEAAKAADRSVSGEIRRAIAKHLVEEEVPK